MRKSCAYCDGDHATTRHPDDAKGFIATKQKPMTDPRHGKPPDQFSKWWSTLDGIELASTRDAQIAHDWDGDAGSCWRAAYAAGMEKAAVIAETTPVRPYRTREQIVEAILEEAGR